MKRLERIYLPLLVILAVLGLWEAGVRFTGSTVFPSPSAVAAGLRELNEQGKLWSYIGDSLRRVAVGYLAGVILGIPVGMLLGRHPLLDRAFNPMIQMLRPISPLAWMPLAIIWFGVSDAAPMFLIFLASFFPIVVAAANGVRNVPLMYRRAATNFGLTQRELLTRVIFPAILPRVLTGLRIALGIAWLVVVAAEMIAVDSGLGYLIIDSRNAGKRYDLVVGGMLLIGAIGLALDVLVRRIERFRWIRWGFNE